MAWAQSGGGIALNALGRILQGTGEGAIKADTLGQHQRALDLTERAQNLANPDTSALFKALGLEVPGGVGTVPAAITDKVLPIMEARRVSGEQQTAGRAAGAALGATQDPRLKALSGVLGMNLSPADRALIQEYAKPQAPHVVAPGSPGYLIGDKYTALPQEPDAGPPEYDPKTTKLSITQDNRGKKSYTTSDITPKPERTLEERFAEAEMRLKANPNDPQAQADHAKLSQAFKNARTLAGERAGGAAEAAVPFRPMDAADKQVTNALSTTLAAIKEFQSFTPDEVAQYAGPVQGGAKAALSAARGVPVLGAAFGAPDERYEQWRALMGRFQAAMFQEGGKQLTGIEKRVAQMYTPTGTEPGGFPQIQAKMRNLEAFTRIGLQVRSQLAKTGKGMVDPAQLETVMEQELSKAGLLQGGTNENQNPPQTKGAPVWQLRETATGRVRRYQPGPGETQPPAGYERVQ